MNKEREPRKERSAASLQAVCFARLILQSLRHRPREAVIAKDHTARSERDAVLEEGSRRESLPPKQQALPTLPTPTPTAPQASSSKESQEGLREGACLQVPSAGAKE